MKITANIPYEIEISEDEQKRITLNYLYKIFNWKQTYSIYDDKVYDTVTNYHHSKSWPENQFIRDATDGDYLMSTFIFEIK